MKLSPIKREHILKAAEFIDQSGIPNNYISNNYYVVLPNEKEYPFKYLTRVAFSLTEGNELNRLDFESNESYRGYVENELKFTIKYYKEGINFIKDVEIGHLELIGGEKYRKAEEEDLRQSQLLKPLVNKINIWAKNSLIEDFTVHFDKHWQWSGTFKPYIWLRIFRPNSSKKVFFVLGASKDRAGLYLTIDCLRSNYTQTGVLSMSVQNKFDEYLKKSEFKDQFISKNSLKHYDWDKLIEKTTRFLYDYVSIYDELENLVTRADIKQIDDFEFTFVDPPTETKTYLNRKRTFEGKVIDWSQKQSSSKLLGDLGEDFVVKIEKKKLIEAGLKDKANLVSKVLDGRGFDIVSFDSNGSEIHIEVKTTTGLKNEPFYFSINEKEFLEANADNYFLYRLHEYKYSPQRTKCFVLSGKQVLKIADFNPTNYEVSIGNK